MKDSTISPSPSGPSLLEGALDLTRPLGRAMRIPGDPPPGMEPGATLEKEGYRLTRLTLGSHTGTHVDAPAHILSQGPTLDQLPLDWMAGPARVVALPDPPGLDEEAARRLEPKQGEALLFRTSLGRAPRPDYLPATGPLVTAGAARVLARAGIRLVGIDYPSIEPLEAQGLPAHHVLLEAGILILEELDLSAAPPGRGILFCFPFLFPRADGAPVRVLYKPEGPAVP